MTYNERLGIMYIEGRKFLPIFVFVFREGFIMAKTTMKDVAKHASVSVATVSNVLNNVAHKTTEATRRRVLHSVRELSYKSHMTARTLSTTKSNLIGLLLPEVSENSTPGSILKDNPFYSEIMSGIEYQARMLGYDILISCIKSADYALELVDNHRLEGIVIIGQYNDEFWREIMAIDIPIVVIDNDKNIKEGVHNVGIDDELGAYLATKHLITLGHECIAFGSGEIGDTKVNGKRLVGFKKAIKEGALDMRKCPVIEESVSFIGGTTVGHILLKDHAYVTGVFATADIMALGIMKIMHQFGKIVPNDLSIIGFDDLNICQYTYPTLTTIRQDVYKKGVEAARILINKVGGDLEMKSQVLPVELIVRDTTKAFHRVSDNHLL